MIIQLLLVAGIAVVVLSFLRNRNAMRFQAGKKILFAGFIAACLASVAQPEALNAVAEFVGVGRGADLLLYVLIVAFIFVVINVYLKFKDLEDRLTVLARRVAIHEAQQRRINGTPVAPTAPDAGPQHPAR